jgi:hypothetical protein
MTSIGTTKKRQQWSMNEVLKSGRPGASRKTVRRYYEKWRTQQGMPLDRCDMPGCDFNTKVTTWRGTPLVPILDHKNGNSWDNRTKNLQFVCPNCDSQLPTRGGRNRGRVVERADDGSFTLNESGQHQKNIVVHEPRNAVAAGATATITNKPRDR